MGDLQAAYEAALVAADESDSLVTYSEIKVMLTAALGALTTCRTCAGRATITDERPNWHTGEAELGVEPCPNPSCVDGKDYPQAIREAFGLDVQLNPIELVYDSGERDGNMWAYLIPGGSDER